MKPFGVSQEWAERVRAVNLRHVQMGGFQRLVQKLQLGLKLRAGGWELSLDIETARQVVSYSADSYGGGTYQTIFRGIVADVQRQLDGLPKATNLSMFGEELVNA